MDVETPRGRSEQGAIPSRERAWAWCAAYLAISAAVYALATLLPQRAPRIIPAGALDAWTPLLPASAWLYLSYFLLMPSLVLAARRRPGFLPAFFAGALATALCLLSHLVVPTAIERVPLPATGAGLLALIRAVDAPLAALPSGHLAVPLAIGVAWLAYWRRGAAVYLLWALALGASTLTTGQHVAWDLAGGAAVGVLAGSLGVAAARAGVDLRSLAAMLLEWAVLAGVIALTVVLDRWPVYALAALVVATRQHGLLMLYHDAVHGLLATHRASNDVLVNALVGVPHLLPVELYRPLHLAHHRHLGSERDPERRLLYAGQPWCYRPLAAPLLLRQLAGDLVLLNNARTLAAWRRDGGQLALAPGTLVLLAAWAAVLLLAGLLAPATTLKVLALWFVPLATLTNLLQKLRSFAEHSAGPGRAPGWQDWTYSWQVGWPGRLTLWPYRINRHREHHAEPWLPWHRLARDDAPARVRPQLAAAALPELLLAARPGPGARLDAAS